MYFLLNLDYPLQYQNKVMQVKPWKQADGVVISKPEGQNHSDNTNCYVLLNMYICPPNLILDNILGVLNILKCYSYKIFV